MSGPDQVRARLVEIWGLTGDEAEAIFTGDNALSKAFIIHGDLDALFQDFDVERKWMREPKPWLYGASPIEAITKGKIDSVYYAAAWIGGRRDGPSYGWDV